jgi:hypothetical protein
MPAEAATAVTVQAPPATWSARYQRAALIAFGVAVATMWIAASYYGVTPSIVVSMVLNDGHCGPTQGIGAHCFGDFSIVREAFSGQVPWSSASPLASYPPIGWLPAELSAWTGDHLFGGGQAGLTIYLALSALSLVAPAVWAARGRWRSDGPLRFILLTIGCAPILAVIDRGNTLAFTVPWILMAAIGFMKGDSKLTFVGILIAALIKPQMIILAILPLSQRKYRIAFGSGVSAAALTLLSFAVFPQHFIEYLSNWIQSLRAYNSYQDIGVAYPYNLGFTRAIVAAYDLLPGDFLGTQGRQSLINNLMAVSSLIAVGIVGFTACVIMLAHNRVHKMYTLALALMMLIYISTVTYSYYLVIFTALAALVLRDPATPGGDPSARGALDAGKGSRVLSTATVVVLALIFAPLTVPTNYPLFNVGVGTAIQQVGLWQLFLTPLLLVYFLTLLGGVMILTFKSLRTTDRAAAEDIETKPFGEEAPPAAIARGATLPNKDKSP